MGVNCPCPLKDDEADETSLLKMELDWMPCLEHVAICYFLDVCHDPTQQCNHDWKCRPAHEGKSAAHGCRADDVKLRLLILFKTSPAGTGHMKGTCSSLLNHARVVQMGSLLQDSLRCISLPSSMIFKHGNQHGCSVYCTPALNQGRSFVTTKWESLHPKKGALPSIQRPVLLNHSRAFAGIISEGCGFTLQNRGHDFCLDPSHSSCIAPRKRLYHDIVIGIATDPRVSCMPPLG